MSILFTPTTQKWSHTTTREDPPLLGQTAPPMSSITQLPAVLYTEVHLSTAIPQVTGHRHQGIFVTIQMTGGQALHLPLGGLFGEEGVQVFHTRISGIEAHLQTTVIEKGLTSTQRPT